MSSYRSAGSIAQDVACGEKTCRQVVETALKRAVIVQEKCNPFTIILDEEALIEADARDDALKDGKKPGLLEGVPIAIKDMTPTKGHPTTLGSWTSGKGLTDYDAVVVERLKAAGAILVAKTTTAEFAFSSFTKTSRYGATRNPWNRERTPGGSSGGSAVAVASGAVPLAEGTDMGGSVRIPAGASGAVGFKPSLGRIPMTIVPSALETISHFGPLASCVADAALFVAATAGHHPADLLSQNVPFDLEKTHSRTLAGKRFAFSMDLGYCTVHPHVATCIERAVEAIKDAGALVEAVDLAWTRAVFDEWAKHWNVLLGLFPNCTQEDDLALMDPDLVTCIRAGRDLPASELMKVDVLRTQMNRDLIDVFQRYDALLCPTNAVPAPLLTERDADYEATLENGKLRAFDMAHPFNMVPACPALSLPVGLTPECLPVGMQIVGRHREDESTLALAASIEAVLEPLPEPPGI